MNTRLKHDATTPTVAAILEAFSACLPTPSERQEADVFLRDQLIDLLDRYDMMRAREAQRLYRSPSI